MATTPSLAFGVVLNHGDIARESACANSFAQVTRADVELISTKVMVQEWFETDKVSFKHARSCDRWLNRTELQCRYYPYQTVASIRVRQLPPRESFSTAQSTYTQQRLVCWYIDERVHVTALDEICAYPSSSSNCGTVREPPSCPTCELPSF